MGRFDWELTDQDLAKIIMNFLVQRQEYGATSEELKWICDWISDCVFRSAILGMVLDYHKEVSIVDITKNGPLFLSRRFPSPWIGKKRVVKDAPLERSKGKQIGKLEALALDKDTSEDDLLKETAKEHHTIGETAKALGLKPFYLKDWLKTKRRKWSEFSPEKTARGAPKNEKPVPEKSASVPTLELKETVRDQIDIGPQAKKSKSVELTNRCPRCNGQIKRIEHGMVTCINGHIISDGVAIV